MHEDASDQFKSIVVDVPEYIAKMCKEYGSTYSHVIATEWLEEEEMKALRIDINKYFKAEIDRAFDVLGIDKGEIQNMIDIAAWLKDGYISKKQYEELKAYIKERA